MLTLLALFLPCFYVTARYCYYGFIANKMGMPEKLKAVHLTNLYLSTTGTLFGIAGILYTLWTTYSNLTR